MDENKNVMVQMGLMKIKVPLNELVIDETHKMQIMLKTTVQEQEMYQERRRQARVCL